jgi:hypothetical protein
MVSGDVHVGGYAQLFTESTSSIDRDDPELPLAVDPKFIPLVGREGGREEREEREARGEREGLGGEEGLSLLEGKTMLRAPALPCSCRSSHLQWAMSRRPSS